MQSNGHEVVNQQPGLHNLTPEELEQYRGMQKWAQIRRDRRSAAGLDPDGSLCFLSCCLCTCSKYVTGQRANTCGRWASESQDREEDKINTRAK